MGQVDETAQKNTVLTLYELTESEATISQGISMRSPVVRGKTDFRSRLSWHGSGAIAESSEHPCKEGQSPSLWARRSTGREVFLNIRCYTIVTICILVGVLKA